MKTETAHLHQQVGHYAEEENRTTMQTVRSISIVKSVLQYYQLKELHTICVWYDEVWCEYAWI